MLQAAGYNSETEERYAVFYDEQVAPLLGPRPDEKDGPVWPSFMTDDHSPVELSWSWKAQNASPEVRLSLEPISYLYDKSCRGPGETISRWQTALLNFVQPSTSVGLSRLLRSSR